METESFINLCRQKRKIDRKLFDQLPQDEQEKVLKDPRFLRTVLSCYDLEELLQFLYLIKPRVKDIHSAIVEMYYGNDKISTDHRRENWLYRFAYEVTEGGDDYGISEDEDEDEDDETS